MNRHFSKRPINGCRPANLALPPAQFTSTSYSKPNRGFVQLARANSTNYSKFVYELKQIKHITHEINENIDSPVKCQPLATRNAGNSIKRIHLPLIFLCLITARTSYCKSIDGNPSLVSSDLSSSSNRNVNKSIDLFNLEHLSTSKPQSATSKLDGLTNDQLTSLSSTQTEAANSQDLSTTEESTNQEDGGGFADADSDAEGCKGISNDEREENKGLTNHERLVNLQSCLQAKVKRRILSATREGLQMFDRLSLSGGCTSSLMNLMTSLSGIKAFAFKFVDASAKIPSGVMYGLLSDFGDFDQCLSIKSDPRVAVEDEAEEGSYSGKYCLMSVKLNYHIELGPNNKTEVPEGLIPDGVLWDELVRNYWTSNSPKGFQVGMCFPSRCTNDDLSQIFKEVSKGYNIVGDVMSCQDGLDIKRQFTPDFVQLLILYCSGIIFILTVAGTIIERYFMSSSLLSNRNDDGKNNINIIALLGHTILCFSIIRNWKSFTNQRTYGLNVGDPMVGSGVSPISQDSNNSTSASEGQNHLVQTDASDFEQNTISNSDSSESCEYSPEKIYSKLTINTQEESCIVNYCREDPFKLLAGLRLFIIIWITIGHSFLYPSANNYQYYRSIIHMNITRDSVWFAATNFTLGIDMLLYIAGLLFVTKLAYLGSIGSPTKGGNISRLDMKGASILRLLSRKILRFWPTYISVIAIAIIVPLMSDGPMWPEMVSKRIGQSCRLNWWANLLMINNYFDQANICVPSSWFVSVLMQLFVIGSSIILLSRLYSLLIALAGLLSLLLISICSTFTFVYLSDIKAPVIRMDESFVLELDDNIFSLYTNVSNNLGPFLVGMAGGYLFVYNKIMHHNKTSPKLGNQQQKASKSSRNLCHIDKNLFGHHLLAVIVLIVGLLVLSSVFHQNYTAFWSAVYWSTHRIGWAIVTGYVIHQCATGDWKFLNDFLSLSTFQPLSKLVFIAYLVYPIFIHIHSGLVRDGLHVSIYNMLNIYTTRLVMTFVTSMFIHLMIELPFCSIEELYLKKWIRWLNKPFTDSQVNIKSLPLLTVAPIITGCEYQSSVKLDVKSKEEDIAAMNR